MYTHHTLNFLIQGGRKKQCTMYTMYLMADTSIVRRLAPPQMVEYLLLISLMLGRTLESFSISLYMYSCLKIHKYIILEYSKDYLNILKALKSVLFQSSCLPTVNMNQDVVLRTVNLFDKSGHLSASPSSYC